MYVVRKTFELAVCLLGYWLGKGFGGWGGGIVLAFVGLCATNYGWEYLSGKLFPATPKASPTKNVVFGIGATVAVGVAAFVLWGK